MLVQLSILSSANLCSDGAFIEMCVHLFADYIKKTSYHCKLHVECLHGKLEYLADLWIKLTLTLHDLMKTGLFLTGLPKKPVANETQLLKVWILTAFSVR